MCAIFSSQNVKRWMIFVQPSWVTCPTKFSAWAMVRGPPIAPSIFGIWKMTMGNWSQLVGTSWTVLRSGETNSRLSMVLQNFFKASSFLTTFLISSTVSSTFLGGQLDVLIPFWQPAKGRQLYLLYLTRMKLCIWRINSLPRPSLSLSWFVLFLGSPFSINSWYFSVVSW